LGDKSNEVEALSSRQRQILRLIANHLQRKEIARLLNISEATVKTHTGEARRRLGVATSRDAARLLVRYEAEAVPADDESAPDSLTPEVAAPLAEKLATMPDNAMAAGPVTPADPQAGQDFWISISPRLKRLNALQCIGLIVLMALALVFIMVAFLAGTAATFQAIHTLLSQKPLG